jgi:hypothetical protein
VNTELQEEGSPPPPHLGMWWDHCL